MADAGTHPYQVPHGRGLGRSLSLAVLMHGLLALMLVLGLSWHSTTPGIVNAELWSALPQEAAPHTEPPPAPPVEQPKPVVQPPPEPQPVAKPDIAIKEEVPKKVQPAPPPVVEQKPVPKKEPPRPLTPAKPQTPDLSYAMNQARQESKGADAQTSGPKDIDAYKARLIAKIKSNQRFPPPPGVNGNPAVTVTIEQLPTGEVVGTPTIVTSSGIPAFDESVQSAVLRSSPLPKGVDGRVARSITLDFYLFPDRPTK